MDYLYVYGEKFTHCFALDVRSEKQTFVLGTSFTDENEDIFLSVTVRDNVLEVQSQRLTPGNLKEIVLKGNYKVQMEYVMEEALKNSALIVDLNAFPWFRIGSRYGCDLVYDYHSLVDKEHLTFYLDNNAIYMNAATANGIYVNQHKAQRSVKLEKYSYVNLYRLTIVVGYPFLFIYGHNRTISSKFSQFMNHTGSIDSVHDSRNLVSAPDIGMKEDIPCNEVPDETDCELIKEEVTLRMSGSEQFGRERNPLFSMGPAFTMMIPVLLMGFMSRRIYGRESKFYLITIVMGVSSSLIAVLWAILTQADNKKQLSRDRERRNKERIEYLERAERRLNDIWNNNYRWFFRNYPQIDFSIQNNIPFHNGFIRLGIGNRENPSRVSVQGEDDFWMEREESKDYLDLQNKYNVISNVPVGFTYTQWSEISVYGREKAMFSCLYLLMVSFMERDAGEYPRIGFFYDKNHPRQVALADGFKKITNGFCFESHTRLLAGDFDEMSEILPAFMNGIKDQNVPMVLILLNTSLIKDGNVWEEIRGKQRAGRLSLIRCFSPDTPSLREGVSIRLLGKTNRLTVSDANGTFVTDYLPDQISYQNLFFLSCRNYYSRITNHDKEQIPEQVSFLKLFGCREVEDLMILKRWKGASTQNSIRVPIGMGSGKQIQYLDIHEKYHGPHGLIAGTTGSGKSELLQTYLMSLAVCFGPDEVNYFLMDYKGGGLGIYLGNLPHCVGVISNLSGNQIKRAMAAITSENKRRQLLLSREGVKHIDEYQNLYRKHKVSDPMPHLLIVIDEFAELKKEEPEFMSEIISLAQVGRSLGIHLILATQKPGGTVDEKVWSNARFHLCLRVQDKQDSNDMIHRPEAAFLLNPGRCYLQVGQDEIFICFQTAFCGEIYEKEERGGATYITDTGRRVSHRNKVKEKEKTTVLEIVCKYIQREYEKTDIPKASGLWYEELPKTLDEKVLTKHGMFSQKTQIVIGAADDPGNQCWRAVEYNYQKDGNLIIFGNSGSGKSTLIANIICKLSENLSSKQFRFLYISIGERTFYKEETLGNYMGKLTDSEGYELFFYHLGKLFSERKRLLQGKGFSEYIRENNTETPVIIIFADNIPKFLRGLPESQEEQLMTILAEGPRCGFYMVGSAETPGDFNSKLFARFKSSLVLEMNDVYGYGDALRYYKNRMVPERNIPGRGLCLYEGRPLEFQGCVPAELPKKKTNELMDFSANIPDYPEYPFYSNEVSDLLYDKAKRELYFALSPLTGTGIAHSFIKSPIFVLSGADGTGKTNLVNLLVNLLLIQKEQLIFIPENPLLRSPERMGNAGNTDFEVPNNAQGCFVIIKDLRTLFFAMEQGNVSEEEKMISLIEQAKGVIVGMNPLRDGVPLSSAVGRALTKYKSGVHLGGNLAMQRILDFHDVPYTIQNKETRPGEGYYISGPFASSVKVRVPLFRKEEKEDE